MNEIGWEKMLLGDLDGMDLQADFEEFLQAARETRALLGEHGCLLEEYIDHLLLAVSDARLDQASAAGRQAGEALWEICAGIVRGKSMYERHSFYPVAAAYRAEHPIQGEQHHALAEQGLYYAMLSGQYTTEACKRFCERTLAACQEVYDEPEVQVLWGKMTEILGNEYRLRYLTKLFWKRFVFGAAIPLFLQGEAANLVLIIGDYDLNSRHQLLRSLLDGVLPSSAT